MSTVSGLSFPPYSFKQLCSPPKRGWSNMEEPEVDAFEVFENVDIKVGKCTVEQLMLILNPCMRKFYMNYRTDPNIDCMTNYNMMRNCVSDEMKQCFNGLTIDKETTENISEAMVMESLPDEDATKFCNRSGVEAPVTSDDQSVLYCSKDFYTESEAMTTEFNDLFSKDRGNPSLCESYEAFGVNFLNLVKEKCRPSFYRFLQKQVLWSDSRDMNPFCNDEQIRYGK